MYYWWATKHVISNIIFIHTFIRLHTYYNYYLTVEKHKPLYLCTIIWLDSIKIQILHIKLISKNKYLNVSKMNKCRTKL